MKLFLAESEDFDSGVLQLLRDNFDLTIAEDSSWKVSDILKEYDIFWFRLKYQIDKEALAGDIRCQFLVSPVTGIDHIDEALCAQKGIRIVCLRGEREFLKEVRATAEMTIGLTIALMRKIVPAYQDVCAGNWRRDLFRGHEIYKKTVGIVGVGRLGEIVGSYFLTMGASVLAYDPYRETKIHDIRQVKHLEQLISASDIISLHVNLTDESRGFFDRQCFQKIKPGAVLINTSRGGLLDEEALLDALESGKLRGAALDVITNEHHIDRDHPLITYAQENDNLLIVPHIGGNTYESFEKTERFIAHKLLRAVRDVAS